MQDGKFKVESGVRPPVVSITENWSNVMLEGLHQFDTLQSQDTSREQKIISMLLNVKGVKRAAFITPEGEVSFSTFTEKALFSLAAISYLEVERISSLLGDDGVKFISLVRNKTRVVISKTGQDITYIEFDARHQLDTILPYIEQILSGGA